MNLKSLKIFMFLNGFKLKLLKQPIPEKETKRHSKWKKKHNKSYVKKMNLNNLEHIYVFSNFKLELFKQPIPKRE